MTACYLVRHILAKQTIKKKTFIIDYVQIPEVKLFYWLKTQFQDLDVR